MSAISYTIPALLWELSDNGRPSFSRTASHIRGRVFVQRRRTTVARGYRTHYGMEVVNTRTGKALITDDCADLARLVDGCHEATAVARGAWFYSIKYGDTK